MTSSIQEEQAALELWNRHANFNDTSDSGDFSKHYLIMSRVGSGDECLKAPKDVTWRETECWIDWVLDDTALSRRMTLNSLSSIVGYKVEIKYFSRYLAKRRNVEINSQIKKKLASRVCDGFSSGKTNTTNKYSLFTLTNPLKRSDFSIFQSSGSYNTIL